MSSWFNLLGEEKKEEPQKPTLEEIKARRLEIMQSIEDQAAAQVGDLLAKQDEWLAAYASWHEADVLGYSFDCQRYGDFLTIFIERKANAEADLWHGQKAKTKHVTTINLSIIPKISLKEGRPPDRKGEIRFKVVGVLGGGKLTLDRSSQLTSEDIQSFEVSPETSCMRLRTQRPFFEDTKQQVIHSNEFGVYSPQTVVPTAARVAVDDKISFDGIGVLNSPYGLGSQVHQKILDEIERGYEAVIIRGAKDA